MLQRHGMLRALSMKYFKRAVLAAGALLLVGNAASAAQDEIYTARTAITLPGTDKVTSFDISFVDPVIGLYFLGDRTNKAVDEIDTTSNTVFAQLTATPSFAGFTGNNDTSGPNGVTTVNHREVGLGTAPCQT
jgi:hypothetical protein